MEPQEAQDVFARKSGNTRIRGKLKHGQAAWIQEGECRTEVFYSEDTSKFHGRNEFKSLMDIRNRERRLVRDEIRRNRRSEDDIRWPPLGRLSRNERVGHRPDPKTAPPIGVKHYGC